jgi:hypothetical protein
MKRVLAGVLAAAALCAAGVSPSVAAPAAGASAKAVVRAPLEQWRIIDTQSGPVNYYSLMRDGELQFVRGTYRPPNKKAVLGFEMPDAGRKRMRHLEWSWRAMQFPEKGDECVKQKGDSAAVVYVTWRRTLRWYSLKYVWSTTRPPGTICDRRRETFVAQDTIVLESGGAPGVWKRESIDLAREFRKAFADGDEKADLPALVGLAVMTDGDQTKTASTGDYADFVLSP